MRKTGGFLAGFWMLGMLAAQTGGAADVLPLVPWPKAVKAESGTLELKPSARIVVAAKELQPLGAVLAEEIGRLCGRQLAVTAGDGAAGDIVLALDPSLAAEGHFFAHTLKAADRVDVKGADYAAVAHGTASLLQLLRWDGKTLAVPRVELSDYSPAAYPGLMVDVARQYNSLDDLRDCVELCRLYKIRYLHLHLNDMESFQFPSLLFPKLGSQNRSAHGGPKCELYPREQLQALVRYADERGVSIVPELETVFHTGGMMRDMPDVFGGPGVLDMTSEKMYEALDALIGEMCDFFASSPFFHIGCDEAGIGGLAKQPTYTAYMEKHNLKDLNALYAYHIERLDAVIRKKGKRTIVWQDSPLPTNKVIVMAWRMDWDHGRTPKYIEDGYPTIQVTWTPSCGWPAKDIYAWHPFDDQIKPGPLALGSQMVLWEQNGSVAVPFLRQKMPARQEHTYSPGAGRTYDDFARRLTATDARLDPLLTGMTVRETGLNQSVAEWLAEGGVGNTPPYGFTKDLELEFVSSIPGAVVRYTVTAPESYHAFRIFGTEPSNTSERATGIVRIGPPKGEAVVVRARLFDGSGKALGATWTRAYRWESFLAKVTGTLAPGDYRFGQAAGIQIAGKVPGGVVRYQVNGAVTTNSLQADKTIAVTNSCEVTLAYFDGAGRKCGAEWKQRFKQVDFDPTSLTYGKPATASINRPPKALAFATDGVIDHDQFLDFSPGPLSLTVDLEKPQSVGRVVLYTYWDGGRYYEYTIELSPDGQKWNMAADASQNKTKATEKGYVHTFPAQTARYIRVTMIRNSANIGLHIVEVRAYPPGK